MLFPFLFFDFSVFVVGVKLSYTVIYPANAFAVLFQEDLGGLLAFEEDLVKHFALNSEVETHIEHCEFKEAVNLVSLAEIGLLSIEGIGGGIVVFIKLIEGRGTVAEGSVEWASVGTSEGRNEAVFSVELGKF